ncbi:hypothetical protein ACLOJK_025270 [Asimina triloba]
MAIWPCLAFMVCGLTAEHCTCGICLGCATAEEDFLSMDCGRVRLHQAAVSPALNQLVFWPKINVLMRHCYQLHYSNSLRSSFSSSSSSPSHPSSSFLIHKIMDPSFVARPVFAVGLMKS